MNTDTILYFLEISDRWTTEEWPTRYISSVLFWTTWRSISYPFSTDRVFWCGHRRAHAYISRFSNSPMSQGRHQPFGLPSNPWIIKLFFIVICAQGGGNLPWNGKLSQPEHSEGSEDLSESYCAQGGTFEPSHLAEQASETRCVYHFTTWA